MKNNSNRNSGAPFEPPADAILQCQIQLLQLIGSARPVEEALDLLVRAVEAQSSEMLCSVLLLDAEGRRLRLGAAPSLPADFKSMIDGAFSGAAAHDTSPFRRERVSVADITTDPLWASYREVALRHGLHTCWSKPIFDTDGRALGTFAIYYRKARTPQTSDLWFVEVAAQAAALVIGRQENAVRLRRWQDLALEQEYHLKALKAEVNGLVATLGRPARFPGVP